MVDILNTTKQTTTPTQTASAGAILNDARKALETGNWDGAYHLSLDATRQDTGNVEAWLIRAKTAASSQERLFCLSQASRLDPGHPTAKQELYSSLRSEFEQSPFLSYIEETDQVYFVRTRDYLSLTVPKYRGIPEGFPPARSETLVRAYRMLSWTVVGLVPAGLGTLVFAPLAIRLAASALRQPLPKPDRVRARLIIALSMLFFAIALFLVWLLSAHFTH